MTAARPDAHDLVQTIPRPAGFTAVCQCGLRYTAPYKRDVTDWHANHKADKADEAMRCPNGCYLGYEAHGELVSRAVRQEAGGATLLRCPECLLAWVTDPAFAGLLAIANFGIPA